MYEPVNRPECKPEYEADHETAYETADEWQPVHKTRNELVDKPALSQQALTEQPHGGLTVAACAGRPHNWPAGAHHGWPTVRS